MLRRLREALRWITELVEITCSGPDRLVQPSAPPWSIERHENCTVYKGGYILCRPGGRVVRSVRGKIIEWPGLPADVYVCDPPAELKNHPHAACLQLLRPGSAWFKMHFVRPPQDFDSARAYLEQMLHEANRAGATHPDR